jgi:hypothetical protein
MVMYGWQDARVSARRRAVAVRSSTNPARLSAKALAPVSGPSGPRVVPITHALLDRWPAAVLILAAPAAGHSILPLTTPPATHLGGHAAASAVPCANLLLAVANVAVLVLCVMLLKRIGHAVHPLLVIVVRRIRESGSSVVQSAPQASRNVGCQSPLRFRPLSVTPGGPRLDRGPPRRGSCLA